MSKSKKRLKHDAKAAAEAKRITGPKLLRLTLKSMAFAVAVAVIMLVLSLLKVPGLNSIWVQFSVMFIVYLLAYPILMSEFRPKSKKEN